MTLTMYPNLPTPTLFAHRGASAHAPENTLAAFELALRQQADAIELDVMLTADRAVIVFHDHTLERVTNGTGKIADYPLEVLQQLDAGAHFDAAFRGERIPTLEEVFETVAKRTFINIELKNDAAPTDDLPERVAVLVARHNLSSRVMVSSFNPIALRRFRQALPQVPQGLLALGGWQGALARGAFGRWISPHEALHPDQSDVTAALVQAAHQRGQRIHPYTVNAPADMLRLFALGIDGIHTDDPLLARQTLQQYLQQTSGALQ
ncbi:MAG: glycerophosphodiester phosphodiesterase family protein [Anaerolineales bacterium]